MMLFGGNALEMIGVAIGLDVDLTKQGAGVIEAVDCSGASAKGLRFSVAPASDEVTLFYFAQQTLSRLTSSTVGGPTNSPMLVSGGFLATPGRYLLKAENAAGNLVAEREVVVRAGGSTQVTMVPNPR